MTDGSVIAQLLGRVSEPRLVSVRIEHPSGGIDVVLSYTGAQGETIRASVGAYVAQAVLRLCIRCGFPTTRRVTPLVVPFLHQNNSKNG